MSRPIDLVAIDGGATGTRLRAIDAAGAVRAEAVAGPSSLTLGVDQAWDNVGRGLAALSNQAGTDPKDVRLYCGFAGGRSPERQAEFRAKDPLGCAEIVIVTDGFASLVGAHAGAPGLVLAIGTGVAAYGLGRDGRVSSASAWGFAIGDEGGGAWIGRRAMTALSRRIDGRSDRSSTLFDALSERVGGSFDAIQSWLADATSTKFATLAPIVIRAADGGDPVARDIMDDATAELEHAVAAVDDGGPLALLGGLADVFRPRFPAALGARITPPKGTALDGLAMMARNGWRDEVIPPARRRRHG